MVLVEEQLLSWIMVRFHMALPSQTTVFCGQIGRGLFLLQQNCFCYFIPNILRSMVQRADKMTGSRQPAVKYALAHLGKPYDVVTVPEECPNISNTCQGVPCGPGRLCLPDGRGSHTCK